MPRLRFRLADVPTLDRRGRGAGLGLKDMGITFSRLRATEVGGMGILAERDCRVDIVCALPSREYALNHSRTLEHSDAPRLHSYRLCSAAAQLLLCSAMSFESIFLPCGAVEFLVDVKPVLGMGELDDGGMEARGQVRLSPPRSNDLSSDHHLSLWLHSFRARLALISSSEAIQVQQYSLVLELRE